MDALSHLYGCYMQIRVLVLSLSMFISEVYFVCIFIRSCSFAPCSEMMGANNFARTIMSQNALPFIEKTTTEGARLFKLKSDHTSVPHSVTKLCQQLTAGAKRTRPNPHCSHKNAPGVKLDLYETHSRLRFFPPQCPEKKPGIFKNTFRVC